MLFIFLFFFLVYHSFSSHSVNPLLFLRPLIRFLELVLLLFFFFVSTLNSFLIFIVLFDCSSVSDFPIFFYFFASILFSSLLPVFLIRFFLFLQPSFFLIFVFLFSSFFFFPLYIHSFLHLFSSFLPYFLSFFFLSLLVSPFHLPLFPLSLCRHFLRLFSSLIFCYYLFIYLFILILILLLFLRFSFFFSLLSFSLPS